MELPTVEETTAHLSMDRSVYGTITRLTVPPVFCLWLNLGSSTSQSLIDVITLVDGIVYVELRFSRTFLPLSILYSRIISPNYPTIDDISD